MGATLLNYVAVDLTSISKVPCNRHLCPVDRAEVSFVQPATLRPFLSACVGFWIKVGSLLVARTQQCCRSESPLQIPVSLAAVAPTLTHQLGCLG